MANKYRHAALGGTFDRLHIGHIHLINIAAQNAHQLTLGLTTHKLHKNKKYADIILPYQQRKKELEAILQELKIFNYSIIPLEDIYGTTISDHSIDMIAVTPQTKKGAEKINHQRSKISWPLLPIITVELIKDQDSNYISSTKIRQGKIDRKGNVYSHSFNKDIILSSSQKEKLKQPQGTLLTKKEDIINAVRSKRRVALIGDYITQFVIDHKLPFNYAIVDYYNNRQPFNLDKKWWKPKHVLHTSNSRGIISAKASKVVESIFQLDDVLVEVEGEEDLLGFPAVLSMPLDTSVFYGQPQEGVVMINVNEQTKDNLARFINES